MNSVRVSLNSLVNETCFEQVIQETLDDRLLYIEALDILKHSQLFSLMKGDACIGFYSIDDLGDSVEAHAYIYNNYRNHSLAALRYIIKSQSKNIKTSVYGTHLHVLKFLTKVGFVVTDTFCNALIRHGKSYDVVELLYIKENDCGV